MLSTRGLGPSNNLCTFGLGPYGVYLVPAEEEFSAGGYIRKKYEVSPRKIFIKQDVGEPSLRLKDIAPKVIKQVMEKVTEITVEGETYFVTGGPEPTPAAALKMLPPTELAAKLKAVQEELGVTKVEARKALKIRAAKEIQAAKIFKMQLVKEDEELALIIIMSEV